MKKDNNEHFDFPKLEECYIFNYEEILSYKFISQSLITNFKLLFADLVPWSLHFKNQE
jgi:hypothetical protein